MSDIRNIINRLRNDATIDTEQLKSCISDIGDYAIEEFRKIREEIERLETDTVLVVCPDKHKFDEFVDKYKQLLPNNDTLALMKYPKLSSIGVIKIMHIHSSYMNSRGNLSGVRGGLAVILSSSKMPVLDAVEMIDELKTRGFTIMYTRLL